MNNKKWFIKVKDKYVELPEPIKASFWFLICAFLQRGISFITTPIFTRLLNPTEYGEYSVFLSWQSIVGVFATLNLSSGVFTRGLVKWEDKKEEFSSALVGLSTVVISACLIMYLVFEDFFRKIFGLPTHMMIIMFTTLWTTSIFGFWSAKERVDYKYKMLVLLTLIISLLKPITGIIAVNFAADNKVEARILSILLCELLLYVPLFFLQIKKSKKLYNFKFWKYALVFNVPLVPHYLSQIVLAQSDRLMINSLVGASAAGIYSLAYNISQIMMMFNSAITDTMSPWLYKSIKHKNYNEIGRATYFLMGFVATLNLFVILVAPEVLAIFAPPKYYEAVYVMPPVIMSVFFMFCYTFFANFEFYYEKTKYVLMASVVGAGLNIILNWIFIPIFGYIVAGYTTLVCYLFFVLGHYFFMKKICKKEMVGISIYKGKYITGIMVVFCSLGFLFMFLYKTIIIRYTILFIGVIIAIVNRRKIISTLSNVLRKEI